MISHRYALKKLLECARDGDPEARTAVAVKHLAGRELVYAPRVSAELLAAAEQQGYAPAACRLAFLCFCGIGIDRNWADARKWLLKAAAAADPLALRNLGFVYTLLSSSGDEEWLVRANRCFLWAAEGGDGVSQYVLGNRYLAATGVSEDIARGRYWLTRAAQQGVNRAFARLSGLRHEPSHPLSLVDAPRESLRVVDFDWPRPLVPPSKQLLDSPQLLEIDGLLSDEECDLLVNQVADEVKPSGIFNPSTGQVEHHPMRSSSERHIDHSLKDIAIHLIEQRWAAAAGLPVSNGEPIMVLRYQPGQEYKPHYDWLTPDQIDANPLSRAGGQRITTVLSYLSNVEAGGGTGFPRLNLTLRPKKGRALVMANCDPQGVPNKRTLHAGLAVQRGEKWLATIWFREHALAISE